MSHLSTIKTEIKSVELAKRTARALGVEVLEDTHITWYGKRRTAAAAVFSPYATKADEQEYKDTHGYYTFGLQKAKDGTFEFVGDFSMMEGYNLRPGLEKLGDPLWWGGHDYSGRQVKKVAAKAPNLFMQEYALQAGEMGARMGGMKSVREKQANGDVRLKVTGGAIPPGSYVQIVARRDGSSSYSAHGVKGPACLKVSDWAKNLLGTVTSQEFTQEFYHDQAPTGEVVHTGSL